MLIFSFIGICLTCRSNKAQTIKQVPCSENENHKETRNINATRENVTPTKKKISTITSPLANVNREYTIRNGVIKGGVARERPPRSNLEP